MLELGKLMEQIRKKFRTKQNPIDQYCFSLVYWQRGMWSIVVTDNWHKWIDADIDRPNNLYETPEDACIGFLRFIEENKINIKQLQSRKWSRKKND